MDRHALRRVSRLRGVDSRLRRLFRRLLRRKALRPQGSLVGDGDRAGASELPELVPGALSLRLRQVPLRGAGVASRPLKKAHLLRWRIYSALVPRLTSAAQLELRVARSPYSEYASRATFGCRLASGPF